MKKTLSLAILLGAIHLASAGTTNLYIQDWGTTNGTSSVNGNGNINLVGWTGVAVSQTAGPYLGIYQESGPSDSATGLPLPLNTVYFTVLTPTQTTPAMIYTTDSSGAGTGGDSSFADIDPTHYTNLTLSVEVRGNGATDTNYFAIRVGATQWYVSTNQLTGSGGLGYPVFTNATLQYTNIASAWKLLTINATDVTIGSTPGADLSGLITGIGIVELPTTNGFNYNMLAVTAFSPNHRAARQTKYYGSDHSSILLRRRWSVIRGPGHRHPAPHLYLGIERRATAGRRTLHRREQQHSHHHQPQPR